MKIEELIRKTLKNVEKEWDSLSKEKQRKIAKEKGVSRKEVKRRALIGLEETLRRNPERIQFEDFNISEKEKDRMLEEYFEELSKTKEGRELLGERKIDDICTRMDNVFLEVGNILEEVDKLGDLALNNAFKKFIKDLSEGASKIYEYLEGVDKLSDKETKELAEAVKSGLSEKDLLQEIQKKFIKAQKKERKGYISFYKG